MEHRKGFPYRLAAVDLDETLLGPDKRVSLANREALERLRELGVQVVLASGRRHENMLPFHEELGLKGLIISSQGALVRHAETGETVREHLLPPPAARAVVARGAALDLSVVVNHPDANYISRVDDYTAYYQRRTASELVPAEDWDALLREPVLKILWLGPREAIARLCPEMESAWPGEVEALITDPEYLEFMPHGVSKAVGLEAAARYYGVEQADVLAFGDGNNDATMLRWAGMGVAMSHALPSAKEAADRIAPPGDPETDFARAVEELL